MAPDAAFDALVLAGCNGTVNFTDVSTEVPQTWSWNFGDGATSTEQNPSHTYTASGTYTVTLVASNLIGSSTISQQVTVDLPEAPTALDAATCVNSPAELTASGAGELQWRNAQGAVVGTGATFTTAPLATATSFTVRSIVTPEAVFVGPETNAFGTGTHLQSTFVGTVNFTAEQACTIVSAWVSATVSGQRIFNLWSGPNGTGTPLQTVAVIVPVGEGRITLDFEVPGPGEYSIGGSNVNLYRNDTGADYPYTFPGLITLTGSSASTGHYYFLYDLEVQGASCESDATTVNVDLVTPDFTAELNGVVLTCTDLSVGATSWAWDFGDGNTSTAQNPVHTYAQAGNYTVTLQINGLTCGAEQSVEIISGVDEASIGQFSVMPNPAVTEAWLTFPALRSTTTLTVRDAQGRLIMTDRLQAGRTTAQLAVAEWAVGSYMVQLSTEDAVQQVRLMLVR